MYNTGNIYMTKAIKIHDVYIFVKVDTLREEPNYKLTVNESVRVYL